MWKVLKNGQTWWNTWNLRDVLWEPNHQPTMTVTGQTYHPSKWWFWGLLIIGLICHIILELCMEYINQFQFLDDVVSGNGPVTQELHTQGSEALIVRGVAFPPILYKNWNKHLTMSVHVCASWFPNDREHLPKSFKTFRTNPPRSSHSIWHFSNLHLSIPEFYSCADLSSLILRYSKGTPSSNKRCFTRKQVWPRDP